MDEKSKDKNEKAKERIGIILLFLIFVTAGIILIKDKENPIKESNSSYSSNETNANPKNTESLESSNNNQVKAASTENKTQKININSASIEDLDTLPGVGEITAQKIIDFRLKNGSFKSIEGIMDVSGIGEAKFEKIKDLISI